MRGSIPAVLAILYKVSNVEGYGTNAIFYDDSGKNLGSISNVLEKFDKPTDEENKNPLNAKNPGTQQIVNVLSLMIPCPENPERKYILVTDAIPSDVRVATGNFAAREFKYTSAKFNDGQDYTDFDCKIGIVRKEGSHTMLDLATKEASFEDACDPTYQNFMWTCRDFNLKEKRWESKESFRDTLPLVGEYIVVSQPVVREYDILLKYVFEFGEIVRARQKVKPYTFNEGIVDWKQNVNILDYIPLNQKGNKTRGKKGPKKCEVLTFSETTKEPCYHNFSEIVEKVGFRSLEGKGQARLSAWGSVSANSSVSFEAPMIDDGPQCSGDHRSSASPIVPYFTGVNVGGGCEFGFLPKGGECGSFSPKNCIGRRDQLEEFLTANDQLVTIPALNNSGVTTYTRESTKTFLNPALGFAPFLLLKENSTTPVNVA